MTVFLLTAPDGRGCCCRSRPKDLEVENDAFHEQFRAQYDPEHNPIYNVNRPVTQPRSGHRRVESQPVAHVGMSDAPRRSLGGDTPFAARPPPDQLPKYTSRASISTQPQALPAAQVRHPPAALQPGRHEHRRAASHPSQSKIPVGAIDLSASGSASTGSPPTRREVPVTGV